MDVAMLMARWTRSFIEKQIHYESKDLWNIETLRGGKINKKNAIKNQYLQITTTILKLVRISLNAVWISVTKPFAQYTQTSASTKVQLMEPSFQSGWSVGRSGRYQSNVLSEHLFNHSSLRPKLKKNLNYNEQTPWKSQNEILQWWTIKRKTDDL